MSLHGVASLMALGALLYRCPECGHDPTEARSKTEAVCPDCGAAYEPGSAGGRIRVRNSEGEVREARASELVLRIQEAGGPFTRAQASEGGYRWEARARARRAGREDPVRKGALLAGFVERLGPRIPGTLRLEGAEVVFEPDEGEGGGEGEAARVAGRWDLTEIRALQAASSSIQLSLPDDSMIDFRFEDDSPRRWEELLRGAIREAWAERGREVFEFQPRIRHR